MKGHVSEASVPAQQHAESMSAASRHTIRRLPSRRTVTQKCRHGRHLESLLQKRVVGISNAEHLYPLVSLARNNQQPFEYLFDYYGHRYHLLLEQNELIEDATENKRLRELSCAVEVGDFKKVDEELAKCLDLFWPHVVKDCDQRGSKSTKKPSIGDRLVPKPFIKIQLKTSQDGVLHASSHDSLVNYPLSDPVENPCPEVRLFEKDEIGLLDEIKTNIFKVEISGALYCLKVAERDALEQEITTLGKLPSHPNLPRLVGLVNAGQGKVDQLVTPFINGRSLRETKAATEEQKKYWKNQISEAVRALHENDLVWGDVNPRNVMIESGTDRLVLIDFAGGLCKGWIDDELFESKAGDMQGLGRLFSYIDDLKTGDSAFPSSCKSAD